MAEPLLFTTTRVSTFRGGQMLTAATAFFFLRDDRLFAVTSRHVLHDEPSGHFPDRIEFVLHVDASDLTRTVLFSVLLYREGRAVWRQATDSGGPVDVAVIELERANLPKGSVMRAFEPHHIQSPSPEVEAGASLRVVAFPLGFYDTRHHLPVVRHAIVASSFGVRFEGHGYFLTDGRMHRGTSGAPVVLRCDAGDWDVPWRLLGVHSAGLDMRDRDAAQDETLGLNCTWYADILMTLTRADAKPSGQPSRRNSEEGKIMSKSSKRDEWEQHNRDEARERAAQQEAAGSAYGPVPTEPYATLAGSHPARDTDQDVAALIDAYERATAAERLAWLTARDLVADERGTAAWNAWRDAVERTQQAARALVDRDTARLQGT